MTDDPDDNQVDGVALKMQDEKTLELPLGVGRLEAHFMHRLFQSLIDDDQPSELYDIQTTYSLTKKH